MTYRAVEARAVVVVVQGFDPPVAGLDRETARDALGREQLVPICTTYGVVNVYYVNSGCRARSPFSQYGRLSSRKNGLLPNSLPQYVQLKHSGWNCLPMAFRQSLNKQTIMLYDDR